MLMLTFESGLKVKTGAYNATSTTSLLALGGDEKILPNGEDPNHSLILFIMVEKKSVMPDPPAIIDETNSNAANDAARILQSNIICLHAICCGIAVEPLGST